MEVLAGGGAAPMLCSDLALALDLDGVRRASLVVVGVDFDGDRGEGSKRHGRHCGQLRRWKLGEEEMQKGLSLFG